MTQNQNASTNGAGPEGNMVNVSELLAEISARLITVGRLALPDTQSTVSAQKDDLQLLVFYLAKTRYAIKVTDVREVVRDPMITRVPGLPDWVLGVTNLHGEIMSVIDLTRFLGIDSNSLSGKRNMLVGKAGDQQIGLMVDDMDVIYSIPSERVISPPFSVDSILVNYLQGAVEREDEFVRLLDCNRLLLGPQMQQFS
jgi:chemotaxis signal transduction protein